MVTIFLLLTTHVFAEEKPKNSLDCLKDPDCSEEMQQNQEQPADMTEEDPIVDASNTPSLWLNLVQMAIMLFIIIGLIYVLIKFLKKRNHIFNNMQAMENLGGISVGQNKSLQIVRIGTKFYVIGVGENVNMLEEITDEALIEDLLHRQQESQQSSNLLSIFSRKKKGDDDGENSPFATLFANELENMKQNRHSLQKERKEDNHYE